MSFSLVAFCVVFPVVSSIPKISYRFRSVALSFLVALIGNSHWRDLLHSDLGLAEIGWVTRDVKRPRSHGLLARPRSMPKLDLTHWAKHVTCIQSERCYGTPGTSAIEKNIKKERKCCQIWNGVTKSREKVVVVREWTNKGNTYRSVVWVKLNS